MNCGTLPPMRRFECLLVILALLATPLALLAPTSADNMADCDGMCCLPHSGHSHQSRNVEGGQDGMACHHGAAGHMLMCSMRSGHHGFGYRLFAPIAPTLVSAAQRVAAPEASCNFASRLVAFSVVGFSSAPFEPPRS
jgi:hypothetical protein